MRTLARTFAPLLVLGALTCATAAHADDVDQLFQQGNAALEAGKFDDALRSFEAVWKTRKTHDVAANLAQAEIQLGKHRDAAEHLAFALRSFPVSGKPSLRKQIEELLATEKTHVAALHVRVSADKADVRVNGKAAGVAPITEELFAEPGTVHVEAALDGYETASQSFEMKAGESKDVTMQLQPRAEVSGPRKEIVIAGGAAALVLAGVGAGLLIAGSDKGNASLKVSDAIYTSGRSCVLGAGNYDARCAGVKSESSAADAMNHAGIGLLISGGAVAAATAAYWIFAPRHGAKDSAVITPILSPTSAGAIVRGSF